MVTIANEQYYSVKEVAETLGKTELAFRCCLHRKTIDIPFLRLGNKRLYSVNEVKKYLINQGAKNVD